MPAASTATETRQHLIDVARALMVTKGFSALGLAEIVAQAGVPKGSFYYYFKSKEDFGQAVLQDYFDQYAGQAEAVLSGPGTARDRLLAYFTGWTTNQTSDNPAGRCLATKLGAEVCDLSEGMRGVLDGGVKANIALLTACIKAGQADASVSSTLPAATLAASLYELWAGASLLAKMSNSPQPFKTAMTFTRHSL